MSKRFALEEYKPKKDAYEKVCAVTGSDLPIELPSRIQYEFVLMRFIATPTAPSPSPPMAKPASGA